MSDERVRELERVFRLSGDVADERRWLTERVRQGDLEESALSLVEGVWSGAAPRELLELLAYAGDPQAGAIVDNEQLVAVATHYGELGAVNVVLGDPQTDWSDFCSWAWGIQRWGVLGVVAALAGYTGHRMATEMADATFEDPDDPYEGDYRRECMDRGRAGVLTFLPETAHFFAADARPDYAEDDHSGAFAGLVEAAREIARFAQRDHLPHEFTNFLVWAWPAEGGAYIEPDPDPCHCVLGIRAHLRYLLQRES